MGWKDWPSWVKDGIVGGLIGIIISLFAIFIVYLIGGFTENYLFLLIGYPIIPISGIVRLVLLPISYIDNYFIDLGIMYLILFFGLGYFIYGSIIGSIIGLIVGKFKSKKEEIKK